MSLCCFMFMTDLKTASYKIDDKLFKAKMKFIKSIK